LQPNQLTTPSNNDRADIISIDGSAPDMDLVYQHTTTFEDITPHHQSNLNNFTTHPSETTASIFSENTPQQTASNHNASPLKETNKQPKDVTVTPNSPIRDNQLRQ